ncbi:unnamed protein product [Oikopleura dioica]|uniref:Uncharacterized protein n=1 Tax=Oikopleura dioica TaxID=34765 RepID=E4WXF8_OIKDI|nr:unnamed protein product [Oikopleura dioica]
MLFVRVSILVVFGYVSRCAFENVQMIQTFFREELFLRKDLFEETMKRQKEVDMLDTENDDIDGNIVIPFSCPEIANCDAGFPYHIESGRGSVIGYSVKVTTRLNLNNFRFILNILLYRVKLINGSTKYANNLTALL